MAVLVVANAVEIAAVISSFLNMTNSFSHQMKLNPDYQFILAKPCIYQASWPLFGFKVKIKCDGATACLLINIKNKDYF